MKPDRATPERGSPDRASPDRAAPGRAAPERGSPAPPLTAEVLELVAERFKALGEPARLQILNALRGGERTVSDLMDETGLGQANASKHLQLLHNLGLVDRRKEGLFVFYRLADDSVLELCDLMCGRLVAQAKLRSDLLSRG